MGVRLKVCGITSLTDALAAVDVGATFLGFNFYSPSPRYIEPEQARVITAQLPSAIVPVGIFVNESEPDSVISIMHQSGMRMAQLHGDESPEYCRAVGAGRVIKAFRAGGDFQFGQVMEYAVWAVLLDAFDPLLHGGTGRVADWNIAAKLAGQVDLFLAGGLTPDNVVEAVQSVAPFAVDLNSGVESAPGVKDAAKLRVLAERLELIRNDY
ncbi:MAG: phosphoribosylanthranilate isomerase [Acidobacteria bacterium]|nr:phosphoribosylanthranilate isomerase [Acidobacteriota bacterium]